MHNNRVVNETRNYYDPFYTGSNESEEHRLDMEFKYIWGFSHKKHKKRLTTVSRRSCKDVSLREGWSINGLPYFLMIGGWSNIIRFLFILTKNFILSSNPHSLPNQHSKLKNSQAQRQKGPIYILTSLLLRRRYQVHWSVWLVWACREINSCQYGSLGHRRMQATLPCQRYLIRNEYSMKPCVHVYFS